LEGIAREKRLKAAQKRPNSGAPKLAGDAFEEIIKQTEEEFFQALDDGSGTIREIAASRLQEFDNK
jgi:dynein intermediate chain 2